MAVAILSVNDDIFIIDIERNGHHLCGMDETKALTVPAQPGMLELIGQLARDPSVDPVKLQAILDMQMQLEHRQAEIAFNEAFARLMTRLPRIKKNGFIEYPPNPQAKTEAGRKGSRVPYAKWEDVDTAIRLMLLDEGFWLSFDTEPPLPNGSFVRVGWLNHIGGHRRCAKTPPLPLDTSGGKNNIQGGGSTASYGNRYTTRDLLNLVFEGEDDDGVRGGRELINDEQLHQIQDLVSELGVDARALCETFGVTSLADMERPNFVACLNMLLSRKERRTQRQSDESR